MSAEKRRKARVQGAWAPPSSSSSSVSVSDRMRMGSPAAVSRRPGDRNRTWQPDTVAKKQFVFKESDELILHKPLEKIITEGGVYDISTGPTAVSRLRFFPNYIEMEEAENIFEQLYQELPWKRESFLRHGISHMLPRLTVWYGDLPYSYSGLTHSPITEWNPVLHRLKKHLEKETDLNLNSLLANLYRDGHDGVDWHSDDEASLGPQPSIVSLSFGDTRNFELRKKPTPEQNGDYTYVEKMKIPLTSGSLLIMEGATQEDWQHRIPKEYHDRGPRINLTFRVIYDI